MTATPKILDLVPQPDGSYAYRPGPKVRRKKKRSGAKILERHHRGYMKGHRDGIRVCPGVFYMGPRRFVIRVTAGWKEGPPRTCLIDRAWTIEADEDQARDFAKRKRAEAIRDARGWTR